MWGRGAAASAAVAGQGGRRLQGVAADHARAGERLKAKFSSPIAAIDHHLSNVGFAATNLVDSASAATCEILAGVFFDNGLAVDAQTAQALYAGILTDTGQFRFNATSRRCFLLAGELVARGAQPAEAEMKLAPGGQLAQLSPPYE